MASEPLGGYCAKVHGPSKIAFLSLVSRNGSWKTSEYSMVVVANE